MTTTTQPTSLEVNGDTKVSDNYVKSNPDNNGDSKVTETNAANNYYNVEESKITENAVQNYENTDELKNAEANAVQIYDKQTMKSNTSFKDIDDIVEDTSIQTCGFFFIPLSGLNFCRNMYVLIGFLCIAGLLQGMIVNGFVNVIASNAERRFNYMSKHSGAIMSSYDVGSLLVILPVTYGTGKHIPQWLGVGGFIQGIGSMIFALPHYLTDKYEYSLTEYSDVCNLDQGDICNAMNITNSATQTDLSNYRYLLMLGQLLHGIGAAPMYTLGIVYLDDNLEQKQVAICIAIFYTCTILGPGMGYIICGKFLEIFTDFDTVDTSKLHIDNTHPRWVGAWWLGFIIFGTCNILLAFPMCCFPKEMPGSAILRAKKVSEAYENDKIKNAEKIDRSILESLILAFRVVINNPVFIFVSIAGAMEAILMIGYGSFAPKFIESQYSMTASEAATLTGIGVVPAGAGGLLLGGILSKYYDLTVLGQVKFCIVTGSISIFFLFAFLIRCENNELAGITVPAHITTNDKYLEFPHYTVTDQCNANCTCSSDKFIPICGRNGVTYYSACMAGCTEERTIHDTIYYGNCSCIEHLNWKEGMIAHSNLSIEDLEFTQAVTGYCPSVCYSFYTFIMLFATFVFLGFTTFIPALNSTLRCLPDEYRSLGIGIQWIIVRILGTIPAPIIFGTLLDMSCILSNEPLGNGCEDKSKFSESKTCLFYENTKMSNYMMIIGFSIKLVSLMLFTLAYVKYKRYEDSRAKAGITVKPIHSEIVVTI